MTQEHGKSLREFAVLGMAALVLSTTATLASAADPMTTATGGDVSSKDRDFITKAAIGGMTEVKLGELAQQNGSSQAVKDFGKKMVDDHTKAGADLTKVATNKGVTVPGTLDKSHQSEVDKLSKLSGKDFDKAYAKGAVSDHKTTISLFEKESKSGNDGDLKSLASTALPEFQGHLKMAQDLTASVK